MSTDSPPKWGPESLQEFRVSELVPGESCYPWDTTPLEYLDFCEEELRENSVRTRINAVAHAKRAIHSHIDFLLHNCGRCLREADFPTKLDLLRRLGIVAPGILAKYNRLRNLIEHEYEAPTYDQAREVVDVAQLFLEATRCYTRPLPRFVVLLANSGSSACTIQCGWDEGEISIVASGTDWPVSGASIIDAKHDAELWIRWVAWILKLMQDSEDPYAHCEDGI